MESIVSKDFDFEFGRWVVRHRRLKERLVGSDDWEDFDGTSEARPILGGNGNVEDNVLHFPTGSYRAAAIRSFDTTLNKWAIWWLDSRGPHTLDVPVIGQFENGVGAFYAEDTFGGRPIRVRFLWLDTHTDCPRWEQAFSVDDGKTWETNWVMAFSRA